MSSNNNKLHKSKSENLGTINKLNVIKLVSIQNFCKESYTEHETVENLYVNNINNNNNQLLYIDEDKKLQNVSQLSDWILGTSDEINVIDTVVNGTNQGIQLSLPQKISETSSPRFSDIYLTNLEPNTLVQVSNDQQKKLQSLSINDFSDRFTNGRSITKQIINGEQIEFTFEPEYAMYRGTVPQFVDHTIITPVQWDIVDRDVQGWFFIPQGPPYPTTFRNTSGKSVYWLIHCQLRLNFTASVDNGTQVRIVHNEVVVTILSLPLKGRYPHIRWVLPMEPNDTFRIDISQYEGQTETIHDISESANSRMIIVQI